MVISLNKGGNVNLTKDNASLKKLYIGLNWDAKKLGNAENDLDAGAFMLDANERCAESDFLFYGIQPGPNGQGRDPQGRLHLANDVMVHSGDEKTGAKDGDDEVITLDLLKVPANIQKIAFAITIHDAENRGQNFGLIRSGVNVNDAETGQKLVTFDLGEDFSTEAAVIVGEVYRYGNDWKFKAIGKGVPAEKGRTDGADALAAICRVYGISV